MTVSIIQVMPVDGLGGVETAARSMDEGGRLGSDFMLLLLAGSALGEATRVITTGRRSPDDPRAHWRAVREILRRKPDVLIGSLWRCVGVLVLVKLLLPSTKTVYFVHAVHTTHFADWLFSAVGMWLADEIWCDSQATRAARLNPRQRRCSRIISFVTMRREPIGHGQAPPANFTVWARLNYQKGVDRALRLIALLAERGVPARFDIHGPDEGVEAGLVALAQDLGIGDRIRFNGPLAPQDLSHVARDASFFLHLSRSEGMGMGVVEAMQLGLIPVVTPVGEMAHYVVDGGNGVMVDPDRLEATADALVTLLADSTRLAQLRTAAIATWQSAPLYREDVRAAAADLAGRQAIAAP